MTPGGGRPSESPLPARWQEGLSPEAARRVLDRMRHLEGRLYREALRGETEHFESDAAEHAGDAAYLDVGRAWQGAWHALQAGWDVVSGPVDVEPAAAHSKAAFVAATPPGRASAADSKAAFVAATPPGRASAAVGAGPPSSSSSSLFLREQLEDARLEADRVARKASAALDALEAERRAKDAQMAEKDALAQELERLRTKLREEAEANARQLEAEKRRAERVAVAAASETTAALEALEAERRAKDALQRELREARETAAACLEECRSERDRRRRTHDELQTLRGNIRVVARTRPARAPEDPADKVETATSTPLPGRVEVAAGPGNRPATFEFDAAFDGNATQADVYKEVQPHVQSFLDGHSVCVLAYGQTGSGKTHTMLGSAAEPGVVGRALDDIFRHLERPDAAARGAELQVSMMEVHMDDVHDLLAPAAKAPLKLSQLGPKLNAMQGFQRVEGLRTVRVGNAGQAARVMLEGAANRAQAATRLNASSSRSHLVFRCSMAAGGGPEQSLLQIVDLAGSERVAKSGVAGERLKESVNINRTLAALRDVLLALQRRQAHVPYRNSTLTQVLQDSLVPGASKVVLLAALAPEREFASETLSTLHFALDAAQVELGGPRPRATAAKAVAKAAPKAAAGRPARRTPLRQVNR